MKPTWNEYFINIAKQVSTRSSCLTRQVGALIVKDKMIISSGYNGTIKGSPNCDSGGCPRCKDRHDNKIQSGEKIDECVCVHAEMNAITQAAFHGAETKEATLYCTTCPCRICAMLIIQAGIKEVYYNQSYALDEISTNLFKQANVKLVKY